MSYALYWGSQNTSGKSKYEGKLLIIRHIYLEIETTELLKKYVAVSEEET